MKLLIKLNCKIKNLFSLNKKNHKNHPKSLKILSRLILFATLWSFISPFISLSSSAETIWQSPYTVSSAAVPNILPTSFTSITNSNLNISALKDPSKNNSLSNQFSNPTLKKRLICPIKPDFINVDNKNWCRIYKALDRAIIEEGLDDTLGYEKAMATMLGLIQKESSFRINVIGKSGEIGLAQIKPATARFICKIPGKELFKVEPNLICSAKYLNMLLSKGYFEKDLEKSLIAYNQGWGNVKKGLYSKQDKRYAKLILNEYSPHFQKTIFID